MGPNAIEIMPSMSNSLRPLLEYIDGYRRRQAAPEDTIVRKKYTHYADLAYIQKRLKQVEDETHSEIWRANQVTVNYMDEQYYQGPHFKGQQSTRSKHGGSQMFPSLVSGQNSVKNLISNNMAGGDSDRRRLAQSLAVNRNHNETLAGKAGTTKNVVTNTNVVQVDYIDAEYDGKDRNGFAKRAAGGYNGGKATKKKGDGDDGSSKNGGNNGGDGGASGKGAGDGTSNDPRLQPGNQLSNEQIRQMMLEDPDAAEFLEGIMPGDGEQQF